MAEGIYIATTDGQFVLERDGFESPADLGFDAARQRVLLPLLDAGEVVIDELAAE